MIIEYKNKKFETKHYVDLSDEECESIKNNFLKKPKLVEVSRQMVELSRGKSNINAIMRYFSKDLMIKTVVNHRKWSIEEVLECNDLIRYFYAKTLSSDTFFPKNNTLEQNIETAFRHGSAGCACLPANFPLKVIDDILKKYNINNNYYDFSCGWGVRLLSSLRNDVNYFGTDPNDLMNIRLLEMDDLYKKVTRSKVKTDIRCQGSEIFIPEWENKIGLAFSSPPYFTLEDYRIGEQSYKEGVTTYEDWKTNYLTNTIKNIQKYVIPDGNIIINIKDYDKYPLYKDTKDICINLGMKFIKDLTMSQTSKRVTCNGKIINNDENMMYFKNEK